MTGPCICIMIAAIWSFGVKVSGRQTFCTLDACTEDGPSGD